VCSSDLCEYLIDILANSPAQIFVSTVDDMGNVNKYKDLVKIAI